MQGRSYINFNKLNFINFSFRVLLLCRKYSENLNNFYENLIEIITHQSFDIILVGFSVNALDRHSYVKQVLNNYMLVVTESTQISFWLTGPSIYLQTSELEDDCAKCGCYNIFQ